LGKWGGRKTDRLQIATVLHPGWTEFCWTLVVNLYFYFFTGLRFRAGQTTIPHLPKALCVVRQFFFALTEQQSAVFYSPTFVPADEHRQALMKDFFSNNLLSTSVPNNSSLTNFLFQKSKKKPSTQHSVWRKCGRGF
jgi:hypothetical protein